MFAVVCDLSAEAIALLENIEAVEHGIWRLHWDDRPAVAVRSDGDERRDMADMMVGLRALSGGSARLRFIDLSSLSRLGAQFRWSNQSPSISFPVDPRRLQTQS